MLQGVVVPKSSEWVQKRPAFYGRWQEGSLRALCVKGNKCVRSLHHFTVLSISHACVHVHVCVTLGQ
jgi:hypothetical protein